MNRALWLLLGLQLRGWLRYLTRGLKTLRGLLLLAVGLGVFIPWLLAISRGSGDHQVEPGQLTRYGPALLLFYCLLSVIFTPSERAIYFTPAEVQFLFAGPFSRRQVLVYKVLLTLLVSLPATVIVGAIVRIRDAWLPGVLVGLVLLSAFLQLFTMALGLVANALGARLYTRGRQVGTMAAVVLLVLALVEAVQPGRRDWRQVGEQLVDSAAWKIASWPLRSFFDALAAESFDQLGVPLLAGLVVNAVLVAVILALDQNYQEAVAAASARRYAALQRLRGRSAGAEPIGAPSGGARRKFSLPDLPFWGGIGPVLWRQMTSAVRGLSRLAILLLALCGVLAVAAGGSLSEAVASEEGLVPILVGVVAWGSVFLTALVPYDFRSDLDRIGLLKTLPIAPWRLVLAQLLTPVLLLSLIQWLALAVLAVLAPRQLELLGAFASLVPGFNFVLLALDNLLFLLFPVRIMAVTPGDFQALGRNVLLSVGKLIGLGVVLALSALAAWPVFLLTGSRWLAAAAAWPVLLACSAALVPLLVLAFCWFDVSRDTPT